jgi:hypothetical protein
VGSRALVSSAPAAAAPTRHAPGADAPPPWFLSGIFLIVFGGIATFLFFKSVVMLGSSARGREKCAGFSPPRMLVCYFFA